MNILFFLKPKSELAFIYDYHTLRQALEIMEHQEHYIGMITRRDIIKYCYDKIKEYEKNGN